ncbi:Antiseptic resistance protein [Buttiauxella agrestis]|uniref:Antiseptic resistance protein n=1 Tax=Buttiauxella agrestis TaxID=82977 RepID=A0A381C1X1_9ENTR|nr:MFS transporter [Buttiauxella agrestis]SUW61898.1 Antiseptic resistance protein [Buttiauxella agrestis]
MSSYAPSLGGSSGVKTSTGMQWLPLLVLCLAQLSTSGDNATLSIATGALVSDLHASMALVSIANAMYSLAAGSLMVAAGMVGLIVGWKKTFRIGCSLLFLAELTAFFSPNMEVFTYGARLLSGIGGSFMIPSVLGLIASNYKGSQQAVAFGAIGAASGVSFVAGPIVCGLLVDHLGWRYAFAAIACLCVVIFAGSFLVPTPAKPERKVTFDLPGVVLTVIGLFSVILGFLKVSSWGLFTPFDAPFTIFGCSPAPFLVLFGLVVLAIMLKWERYREAKVGSALIPLSFLSTPQVRNGLCLTAFIFLAYGSGIFVTVSFVQVVVGLNSIQTGLMILPFALGVVIFSLGLPVVYKNANPKRMCQGALVIGTIGSVLCIFGFQPASFTAIVPLGMCFIGISMGVVSAYSSYIVTSALPARDAQQSGGVQATSRNVGQAIGVAVCGMVMLTAVTMSVQSATRNDSQLSPDSQAKVSQMAVIPYLSDANFSKLMLKNGISQHDVPALTNDYQHARLNATRAGMVATAVMTLLFLFGTRNLPTRTKTNQSDEVEDKRKNKAL